MGNGRQIGGQIIEIEGAPQAARIAHIINGFDLQIIFAGGQPVEQVIELPVARARQLDAGGTQAHGDLGRVIEGHRHLAHAAARIAHAQGGITDGTADREQPLLGRGDALGGRQPSALRQGEGQQRGSGIDQDGKW